MFANAKGVLVCPKITKGGFIVGVESGNCVLTKGAPKPIYYGTSALKAGLLAGVASYSMILVLNTDAAVEKFTKSDREWEMGVDASVAVAKVGAGGALDTTNLKKDIVSFIFGDKGLMGDVSFSGSRFKKARGPGIAREHQATPDRAMPGPGRCRDASDLARERPRADGTWSNGPRSSRAFASRGPRIGADVSGTGVAGPLLRSRGRT